MLRFPHRIVNVLFTHKKNCRWRKDDLLNFVVVEFVRNRTLTLIEREDDTRSWGNFLIYFSHYHNVIPSKGLEIHTYRLVVNQEYARC
jgi:hypothetical protein